MSYLQIHDCSMSGYKYIYMHRTTTPTPTSVNDDDDGNDNIFYKIKPCKHSSGEVKVKLAESKLNCNISAGELTSLSFPHKALYLSREFYFCSHSDLS